LNTSTAAPGIRGTVIDVHILVDVPNDRLRVISP
jgi:hypothetical protein